MKGSAIERRRRFRGSEVLSIVSFKRTFAESENWKGMMLPTGLYSYVSGFHYILTHAIPRTHALLQAIQANGLPGCPFHFL